MLKEDKFIYFRILTKIDEAFVFDTVTHKESITDHSLVLTAAKHPDDIFIEEYTMYSVNTLKHFELSEEGLKKAIEFMRDRWQMKINDFSSYGRMIILDTPEKRETYRGRIVCKKFGF